MDFNITSKKNVDKKRWEVSISGEIDIFNSGQLKSTLLDLIKEEQLDLYLDFDKLIYIDSTALGALVAVLKNVRQYEGDIYITKIKPNLEKLFKITNLDKVFIIEEN